MFTKMPPTTTSTVLKRLQPLTTYDITVIPVYKTGEGKQRQGEGTTGTLICDTGTLQRVKKGAIQQRQPYHKANKATLGPHAVSNTTEMCGPAPCGQELGPHQW